MCAPSIRRVRPVRPAPPHLVLAALLAALWSPAALAKSSANAAPPAHLSAAAREMTHSGQQGDAPSPAPRHRRAGCDSLDAENSPACAGTAARTPDADRPPSGSEPAQTVQPPASAAPRNQSAASAAQPQPVVTPPSVARPAAAPTPRTVHRSTPVSPNLARARRFWPAIAAIVGLLALAAGALVWALVIRPRAASPVRASKPTAYRRDLVLSCADGRGWRIPGHALSPGVCVGSDPRSPGYVNGDRIDKRHVEFWVSDGRLWLRRRSTQPTFLNDRNLSSDEHCIVSTGDRIRLGESEFTLLIE